MTKKQLEQKIKEAFAYHKDTDALIVTEDGNIFLPEAKNFAMDHARKKGIKWFEVKRKDYETKGKKGNPATAKDEPKKGEEKEKEQTEPAEPEKANEPDKTEQPAEPETGETKGKKGNKKS